MSKCAVAIACLIASQSSLADCYLDQKDCSQQQSLEGDRVKAYDKPAFKDPLGNALIGGGVTGVVRGSAAAGSAKVVRDVGIQVSQATAQDWKAPPKAYTDAMTPSKAAQDAMAPSKGYTDAMRSSPSASFSSPAGLTQKTNPGSGSALERTQPTTLGSAFSFPSPRKSGDCWNWYVKQKCHGKAACQSLSLQHTECLSQERDMLAQQKRASEDKHRQQNATNTKAVESMNKAIEQTQKLNGSKH